jgi:hypothetical protein
MEVEVDDITTREEVDSILTIVVEITTSSEVVAMAASVLHSLQQTCLTRSKPPYLMKHLKKHR